MKRELESLRASIFLPLVTLFFFFSVAPVLAESMEERIKALEEVQKANAEELKRLKGEQAQLKGEQMEFRKEATAAAAKVPEFRYRPGSGLAIRGPNKDWEFGTNIQADARWQFYVPDDGEAAGDDFAPTQGSFTLRRLRPRFWFDTGENLFWGMLLVGNTGADRNFNLQTGQLQARFDHLNPYLPRLYLCFRCGPGWFTIDANYGSMGGEMLERSMMTQGWINTTSSTGTISLNWDDVPLPGLPGTFRSSLMYAPEIGDVSLNDNLTDTDDNKDFLVSLGLLPFSKTKSKWLQGMHFGIGTIVGNVGMQDSFGNLRARVNERGNRVDFWRQNTRGFRHWIQPYYEHRIGPYRIRAMWAIQRFRRDFTAGDSQDGDEHGLAGSRSWYIRQGLFIWSPKGLLTGSTSTPGSWRFSVGFERLDIDQGSPDHLAAGRFSGTTMHVLLRNFNLTYFVRRNFKMFAQYNWYTFSELTGLSGSRKTALGCENITKANCDYGAIETGFQYRF